jgi:hypothetical protein
MLVLHRIKLAKAAATMNAQGFRALADRCRDMARVAERDDIRQQLRQWIDDFEAEAEVAEGAERRPHYGRIEGAAA